MVSLRPVRGESSAQPVSLRPCCRAAAIDMAGHSEAGARVEAKLVAVPPADDHAAAYVSLQLTTRASASTVTPCIRPMPAKGSYVEVNLKADDDSFLGMRTGLVYASKELQNPEERAQFVVAFPDHGCAVIWNNGKEPYSILHSVDAVADIPEPITRQIGSRPMVEGFLYGRQDVQSENRWAAFSRYEPAKPPKWIPKDCRDVLYTAPRLASPLTRLQHVRCRGKVLGSDDTTFTLIAIAQAVELPAQKKPKDERRQRKKKREKRKREK